MKFRVRNLVTREATYHETRAQAIDVSLTESCRGGIVTVQSLQDNGIWEQTNQDFTEAYTALLALTLEDKLRRAGRLPEQRSTNNEQ